MDGILALERPRTRRWVSVVAAAVPVVAFLAAFGWFVRAYVAPAMIDIPAPAIVADSSPPESPAAEPAASPASEVTEVSPMVPPMMASLEFAPPPAAWGTAPTAAEPELAPSQSIAGPIPLPRSRPRQSASRAAGPVPMPRSRPASQ